MKQDTIIIMLAAAAGLYAISKMIKPAAGMRPPTGSGPASSLNNGGNVPITEINNTALPGQEGWGWQYYSDGTAISPTGVYYYNGQRVWSPASGQMGL